VIVSRGFDYAAETRDLQLTTGATTECVIRLARVSPLRKEGWVCGDSHVHMRHGEAKVAADFAFVALTARAEAMDYMHVAQAWNIADATPEILTRECDKVSTPDCVLHWNMEAPKNCWKGDVSHAMGHCWNLGLLDTPADGSNPINELFALSAGDYENKKVSTPNFESHAYIHGAGGIVAYTHPCRSWRSDWPAKNGMPFEHDKFVSNLAQELPFDTVAGPTYDTIDIMMRTEERVVNENGEKLWFMLLNQGYRIPATASSDACFDRIGGAIPGAVRVYTRIEGEPTPAKVATSMKAGRNFVTSGPLLSFSVGRHGIGDIVPVSKRVKLNASVHAWASGALGEYLTKIDVIRNGEIYKSVELTDKPGAHELNFDLEEDKTSWYIVKCYGSRWNQYAVSNPIYFEAPGYRAPEATRASVELQAMDSVTGKPLDGSYDVVEMMGRTPKVLHTGEFIGGKANITAPATARIRVHAVGYEGATKSIFMDTPALLNSTLEMRLPSLLDWNAYEDLKKTLSQIQLKFDMRSSA
jgi:hypothetical protein